MPDDKVDPKPLDTSPKPSQPLLKPDASHTAHSRSSGYTPVTAVGHEHSSTDYGSASAVLYEHSHPPTHGHNPHPGTGYGHPPPVSNYGSNYGTTAAHGYHDHDPPSWSTYHHQHNPSKVDRNTFKRNMSIAKGFLDISLLSANCNQLRNLISLSNKGRPAYYVLLCGLIFSIALQVSLPRDNLHSNMLNLGYD